MTLSVIIPSYQHGSTLAQTLDSLLAQSRKPDEIIVVNDGSTDNTKEVLAEYKDKVIIINQENKGGNAARNVGFDASKGKFVIFCDADIVMKKDMLLKLEQVLLSHPEASYAYCGFKFGWKSFPSFSFSSEKLRKHNYIHTTSLVRREHFPRFDESIKRLQDWDVWLTMLSKGYEGIFVDEELFSVLEDTKRKGISQWRPSFMYTIPWERIGWKPASMKRYEEARSIIAQKHNL